MAMKRELLILWDVAFIAMAMKREPLILWDVAP
jgi:hypothetical protein